ncbi:MAG: hypothetical protein JW983_00095 [Elusimicrobia bacterium]|nr:hypothetical protein [Elusimicrobiota bacterium]
MRDRKKKGAGYYSGIVVFVILCGAIWVWQKNTAIKLGYEIREIKDKIYMLSEENKYLEMKIMDIMAMDKLEKVAKKELGLVTPKSSDIVVIEE